MVRAKKVAVDDVDGDTLKLMKGEEKGARWRRRKKESSVAWRRRRREKVQQVTTELPPSGRACGSDLGTCRAARTNGCVRFATRLCERSRHTRAHDDL